MHLCVMYHAVISSYTVLFSVDACQLLSGWLKAIVADLQHIDVKYSII